MRYLARTNEIKIEKEMKEMRLRDKNLENDKKSCVDATKDKLQNIAQSPVNCNDKDDEGNVNKRFCLLLLKMIKCIHLLQTSVEFNI